MTLPIVTVSEDNQSSSVYMTEALTTTSPRKRKESMILDLDFLTSFDATVDEKQDKSPIPLKRRKVSMSRSSKSYLSIATAVEYPEWSSDEPHLEDSHHDSLLFQLHYVSSDAETQGSRSVNSSAEHFPSISSNHCIHGSDNQAQHSQSTDISPYGWFVELEDDADDNDKDLAFKELTAPKKNIDLDNEVDWACAADTVDDVLGDFF